MQKSTSNNPNPKDRRPENNCCVIYHSPVLISISVQQAKKMKNYAIPSALFLCFAGVYMAISVVHHNDYLFQPVWDVKHYLDISEIGYQVYPCTPGVEFPAGDICGNPGWYPMWPLVVRAFRPLAGGSSKVAFIGLTFLFGLLGFVLMYRFVEKHYDRRASFINLLAIALGPASFYLLTGFPYALFMFLFASFMLLLYSASSKKREIVLFLTALAISLTYPTGILVAVTPLIYHLFGGNYLRPFLKPIKYWLRLFATLLPFILGPLLLWTYFYFKFDNFFLQLDFQAKYGRALTFPLYVMYKSLTLYPLLSPENATILWYGLIFLIFIPFGLKKELWILGLVMLLFSLSTGTTMSIYRHYLIIFPAYMIIATSTRPLWLKLIYIAGGFVLSLAVLFPRFMAYRLI
jgi:hypothetical protein